jgi:sugar (pentulose or hexulose) kinase
MRVGFIRSTCTMYALGLDLGSSSIKGTVLHLDRGVIGRVVTRPFPAALTGLPPECFEVSPDAIEAAARAVISELLQHCPAPAGLFVSGQMGGIILVDADGRALTNYLSWRDQRTRLSSASRTTCLEELRTRWSGGLLESIGNELQPGSTTSLLFWLQQSGQLDPSGTPVTVADYVIGRLGTRVGPRPTMHVTHAIGMLDLETSTWHRTALRAVGLKNVPWPDLVDRIEPQVTAKFGDAEFPVYGAYGDQQTALCGAGLQTGELSLNISTGSQVSRRTATYEPGPYQSRRYFFGDWLNTITHLPAGRSLNVLVDLLTELAAAEGATLRNPWATLMQKVDAVTDSSLEINLAFFAGPLGNSGRINGITTENLTAGNLFHAAFQNMADNYAHCAHQLDPEHTATAVVLSGGLTKSALTLRRLIAQRFPKPLREADGEETLLGLLQLARSASGGG